LVDHEVDDYACDADVEPEGESPAGDLAVFVEALDPGAAKGDENEWVVSATWFRFGGELKPQKRKLSFRTPN